MATGNQRDGFIKFDLTGFSQDIAGATVRLMPQTVASPARTNSLQVVVDNRWTGDLNCNSEDDYAGWGPVLDTWTPAANTAETINVDEAVRRQLRVGDMDFSGGLSSVVDDIEAFSLYFKNGNQDAYNATFGLAATIPNDVLYRGDVNFDGAITPYEDGNALLARYGYRPGDSNFDRYVDIFDINIISDNWAEMNAQYTEGNVNFDNTVDILTSIPSAIIGTPRALATR